MTDRKEEMAARRCRQDDIATNLTGELSSFVWADHGILTRPASGGRPRINGSRFSLRRLTLRLRPPWVALRAERRSAFQAPQPPILLTGIAASIIALARTMTTCVTSGPREVPAGGAAGRGHSRDPDEGRDADSDGPDDGE
ncbi:MAG: hypothetical protein ACK43M_24080, partial [Allorhizobium sp.]